MYKNYVKILEGHTTLRTKKRLFIISGHKIYYPLKKLYQLPLKNR